MDKFTRWLAGRVIWAWPVLWPLTIVAVTSRLVFAERLPIKAYTTGDGLVSNRISRIVRDSRGYMWFCTENGLSRFDGHAFTNYTTEQGLPDNEVDDLLETRSGTYWVATGGGLCRYDPRGSFRHGRGGSAGANPMFTVFRPTGDPLASAIKSLYEDRSGSIWVGTWRGLYRLEQNADRIEFRFIETGMPVTGPQSQVVRNILEDRAGSLWLTTSSGLYRRSPDRRVDRFTREHGLSSETLMGIVEDSRGRLWVGDRNGGLCRLVANPQGGRSIVARKYTVKDGLGCTEISCLYQSADGRLWIGGDCGLAELTLGDDDSVGRIRTSFSGQELTDPRIWALAEDSQGDLWIGTANGAVKVARGGFISYTEADGLGSRSVCSISQTPSGEVYAYTKSSDRSFINRFDGRRFLAIKLNLPRYAQSDVCGYWMQDRDDRWWMAAGQLMLFPKTRSIEQLGRMPPTILYPGHNAPAAEQVFRVYEDRRGDVWFSTRGAGRLMRWDRGRTELQTYFEADGLPPPGTLATAYAEDFAGNLWIGFGEGGLVRQANNRFQLFTPSEWLPQGVIRDLLVDSEGRLWVACSRGGLARVDNPAAPRPVAVIYTVSEGLSSNRVWSIVEDAQGRLYIGTDQGLDRLDPATGTVKHFTTADGLANNLVLDSFRDKEGSLWFATDTGLSRLVPGPEQTQPPPSALINGLQISGNRYPLSELGESTIHDLELAPGQTNIRIDFVALAFGAGDTLRFQHRLEGADLDWSAPSDQRAVNFANLAPGTYRFQVRAVNADGAVSSTPASFAFTILNPIWLRWWFMATVAVLIGLAGYSVYRFRVAQLVEIDRVRTRIATDLHDDIGANLSKIAILSEVAHQQLGGADEPADTSLSSIARISRESLASMRDIVWAVNPRRDRLFDLTRRMRGFASEIFTNREIVFEFQVPDRDSELRLGADVRRDVFLIFKEAVNNAVRHSECTRAAIKLNFDGGWLSLEVMDNGRGLDPAMADEGHGLWSMRRRAESFGGRLEIISKPEAGTTVRLTVPVGIRLWPKQQ